MRQFFFNSRLLLTNSSNIWYVNNYFISHSIICINHHSNWNSINRINCSLLFLYERVLILILIFNKNGFDSFSKLQFVPVCMRVFLSEVTYETKNNFLCCLVEILQFHGQNFYGSQGKNSVKSRNCHTKYFNCNAAQFSKTVYHVFS